MNYKTLLALLAFIALAVSAHAQTPSPSLKPERVLHVPIEDLDAVLNRDQRGVFLPRGEYTELLAAAQKNLDAQAGVPQTLVVSRVDYVARIDGERLVITTELSLENFLDGWMDLALPVAGLAVEKVLFDDQPAQAARDGGNLDLLHLFFNMRGKHKVTLELSAQLIASGSDQAAGLAIIPAPSGTLKVTVPAGKFLLADGLSLQRPAGDDQPADYAIAIGNRTQVHLQITGRKQTERTDALNLASTAFGVRVTPSDLAWTALTSLQVYGQPLDRLTCRVPRTLEITSVESNGLEGWELADDPKDANLTVLTLAYRQPFTGSRSVTFRGVVPIQSGVPWEIPGLALDSIPSHVGAVRVHTPAGLRVRLVDAQGARAVQDINEPEALAPGAATVNPGDAVLVYQTWKPDFKLSFTTEAKAREVQAALTNLLDINAQGLDLTVTVTVQTRFAPLFDFHLALPLGWQVVSTLVEGQPLPWQLNPEIGGVQQVEIPLNPPLMPGESRTVQLLARLQPEQWPIENTSQRQTIPEVRLPQVSVVEGMYGITSEDGLEVTPVDVTGLDPARQADLDLLNQRVAGTGRKVRVGYNYQDTVFTGQLELSRQATRLSAVHIVFARLDRENLVTHLESALDIQGGGLRRLEVRLPESLGTDLRFRLHANSIYDMLGPQEMSPEDRLKYASPFGVVSAQPPNASSIPYLRETVPARIVEQTPELREPTLPAPADGQRTWHLKLDQFARGSYVLLVDARMPRGEAGEFAVPSLSVMGAERESGFVALEAAPDQYLMHRAVDGANAPLVPVDPVDFPATMYRPSERVVAGYRFDRPNPQVVLSEKRFDWSAVPTAIIHSVDLTSILGETGELQHKAVVNFSAVGVQSMRIALGDADLWAAMLDGQPVQLRKQPQGFLLAAPREARAGVQTSEVSKTSEVSRHTLTLLYRSQGPALNDVTERTLTQEPPRLFVIDGRGEEQPLEALEQSWTLLHPPDLLVSGSEGAFRPTGPLWSRSLLARWYRETPNPTWPQFFNGLILIGATVVGLLVLRLAVYRLTWSGKLVSFVAVLFAVGLASQMRGCGGQVRDIAISSARYDERAVDTKYAYPNAATSVPPAMAPVAPPAPGGMAGFEGGGMGGGEGGAFGTVTGAAPGSVLSDPFQADADRSPVTALPAMVETAPESYDFAPAADTPVTLNDVTQEDLLLREESKKMEDRSGRQEPETRSNRGRFTAQPGVRRGWSAMGDGQSPNTSEPSSGKRSLGLNGYYDSDGNGLAAPMDEEQMAGEKAGDAQFWMAQDPRGVRRQMSQDGLWNSLQIPNGATQPLDTKGYLHDVDRWEEIHEGGRGGRPGVSALLSLSLDLTPPTNSVRQTFRHHGQQGLNAPIVDPTASAQVLPQPALDIRYRRTGTANLLTLAIMAGVALLLWWNRAGSVSTRSFWLLLTIVLPWSLAPLLPPAVQDLVDGVFLGGLLGAGLWLLFAVAGLLKTLSGRCFDWFRRADLIKPVTTGILLVVLAAGLARRADAQDPPADVGGATVVVPTTEASVTSKIFLPQAEYLKLYQLAHPEDATPPAAPVDGLIAESLYAASIVSAEAAPGANASGSGRQRPHAQIKVRLLLHNMRPHAINLLLPITGGAISSAKLGEGTATLMVRDHGTEVVVPTTGLHVLDLEWVLPVETTGPAGRLTLNLHAATAAKLRLTLPGAKDQLDVQVNGTTGAYRRATENETEYIETPVDRGSAITVAWQPKQTRGAQSGIVQVDSAALLAVEDTGVASQHNFQFKVRQGSLNETTFTLPAGVGIQEVAGDDVGGWQIADGLEPRAEGLGPDKPADAPPLPLNPQPSTLSRTLKVFFRRAVTDGTFVRIRLFQAVTVAEIPRDFIYPQVVPIDATREVGYLAVYSPEHFQVRPGEVTGAAQINLDKYLPAFEVQRPPYPPQLAYRFAAHPVQVGFTVARRQPETRASVEHGVSIGLRKTRVATRIEYELAGAPRPSVSVLLPAGYLPVDVFAGSALADWYVAPGENGQQVLTIELDQPRTGTLQVALEGHFTRAPTDPAVALAVPLPVGLTRLSSSIGVWVDDVYAATLTDFGDWKSVPADQTSERLCGLRPTPIQFAFKNTGLSPGLINFSLARQQPVLTGDTVTILAVDEATIDYGFTLRWKITRAAADEFSFTTPAWLEGKLDITAPGIRQLKSTKLEGGQLLWTISLIDPVRDLYIATAAATLALPADDIVELPSIRYVEPTLAPGEALPSQLETQRHFGILVNLSTRQLNPVDIESQRVIAREALPLVIQDALIQQAMAIVEITPDRPTPRWQSQRLIAEQDTQATVTAAEMTSVLEHDGSLRTLCVYTVRNRGQQFLGLELPANSPVLSIFVKGRPARGVHTKLGERELLLVPLPQTSLADLSFDIRVVLRGHLGRSLPDAIALQRDGFDIPAPQVVSREDSPEFGATVARTAWIVHVPTDLDARHITDNQRTNVTFESGDDSTATTALFMMQKLQADAAEMLRQYKAPLDALASTRESARRSQVKNNIKQIDQAIKGYKFQYEQVLKQEGQQKLNTWFDNNEDQLNELGKIVEQERIVESAQQAVSQGQIALPQAQGFSFQQANGRNFILGNNAAICDLNCPTPQSDATIIRGDVLNFNGSVADQSFAGKQSSVKSDLKANADGGQNYRSKLRGSIQQQDKFSQSFAKEQMDQVQQRFIVPDQSQLFSNVQQPPLPGWSVQHSDDMDFYHLNRIQSAPTGDDTAANQSGAAPGADASGSLGWSRGGLSLDFEIPKYGQALTFTKIGGTPKLALGMVPTQSWDMLYALGWAAAWLVSGWWLLRALKSNSSARGIVRPYVRWAWLACVLAAFGLLLLPVEARSLLYITFLISGIILALHRPQVA